MEMKKEPVILVAEDAKVQSELFVFFLSELGKASVVVMSGSTSAIQALTTQSFDFVICDGTDWDKVHEVLEATMKSRYCIYTGDRNLCESFRQKGIYAFPKGAIISPGTISDWVLTKLKNEGFSCTPYEEITDQDIAALV
jgi:hypothetical protein